MPQNLQNFAKFQKFQLDNLVDFEKMLQNAYFLAKIGADTAENEQHLAEICRDAAHARGTGLHRAAAAGRGGIGGALGARLRRV